MMGNNSPHWMKPEVAAWCACIASDVEFIIREEQEINTAIGNSVFDLADLMLSMSADLMMYIDERTIDMLKQKVFYTEDEQIYLSLQGINLQEEISYHIVVLMEDLIIDLGD